MTSEPEITLGPTAADLDRPKPDQSESGVRPRMGFRQARDLNARLWAVTADHVRKLDQSCWASRLTASGRSSKFACMPSATWRCSENGPDR